MRMVPVGSLAYNRAFLYDGRVYKISRSNVVRHCVQAVEIVGAYGYVWSVEQEFIEINKNDMVILTTHN